MRPKSHIRIDVVFPVFAVFPDDRSQFEWVEHALSAIRKVGINSQWADRQVISEVSH